MKHQFWPTDVGRPWLACRPGALRRTWRRPQRVWCALPQSSQSPAISQPLVVRIHYHSVPDPDPIVRGMDPDPALDPWRRPQRAWCALPQSSQSPAQSANSQRCSGSGGSVISRPSGPKICNSELRIRESVSILQILNITILSKIQRYFRKKNQYILEQCNKIHCDTLLVLWIRILPSASKKVRKTLFFTVLWHLHDYLSFKTDVNVPSKVKIRARNSVVRFRGSGSVWYFASWIWIRNLFVRIRILPSTSKKMKKKP